MRDAVSQSRQGPVEQGRGRRLELSVQRERGFLEGDRDPFLVHEVAGVGHRDHGVERHARLFLAVDEHPVDRGATPVAG